MKTEPKRNLPTSVQQRLLTLSDLRKEPFDLVLVHYGIERLLYRLSRSSVDTIKREFGHENQGH